MEAFYFTTSLLLIFFSLIPLIQNQFWFFRVFDFLKIQILFLQLIIFVLGFIFITYSTAFIITQLILTACIIWEIALLYKYTTFYKVNTIKNSEISSKKHTILSTNIYQFNTEYKRFTDLINTIPIYLLQWKVIKNGILHLRN